MSANYGYGYDQYAAAAYAGYTAAAQYQAMATQQQQPATYYQQQAPPPQSAPNTQQYANTGYNYQNTNYQSYHQPATYPPYVPSQPSTTTTAGDSMTTPTSSAAYSYTGYPQSGGGPKDGSRQAWNTSTGSYGAHNATPQVAYPNTYPMYTYPQYGNYGYGTTPTSSVTTPTTSGNITPHQHKVIARFAHQKMKGGDMKTFLKKKVYENPEKFYCEVCKAGCGSAFTYKAHIEGKNHKKRVQQQEKAKSENASEKKPKPPFYCDVCEIGCSNKDAFEAHIKGNRHIKTVNLFRRLGKPVPPMTTSVAKDNGTVQVTGPRITFVGGKKLSSTGLTLNKTGDGVKVYPPGAPEPDVKEETNTSIVDGTVEDIPPDIEPVGEDLVNMVTNDPRSPNSTYYCTMCACFFNDALAKTMHCKGRRHRLNYKKQYDPNLKVELPKSLQKQIQKKKEKLQQRRDIKVKHTSTKKSSSTVELQNLRKREANAIASLHCRGRGYGYGPDFEWPPPNQPHRNPQDDKIIFFKHKELCPEDDEQKAVQLVVNDVEKALKMVSDALLMEKCRSVAIDSGDYSEDVKKDEALRQIRGIMRVGSLAHNILMRGSLRIDLLLMCIDKPTKDLLNDICASLPSKFASISEADQKYVYHVTANPRKAGLIIVATIGDFPVTVHVTLTSTVMKDEQNLDDEGREIDHFKGVLDRPSCMAALSSLHQTQWFQGRCRGLPCFSLVMRIFIDLTQRITKWAPLDGWMLELLVFKCIVTANPDFMHPGDIFRRVIECVASGIFLPGGSGLMDPCERTDAAESLTPQQRADITFSAQHYLRMIAFNQLHLILDITPPDNYAPYQLARKESVEEEESDSKRPRIE